MALRLDGIIVKRYICKAKTQQNEKSVSNCFSDDFFIDKLSKQKG